MMLRELLEGLGTSRVAPQEATAGRTGGFAAGGLPVPGGAPAPQKAQSYLAQSPTGAVATDTTACPLTLVVLASTRAGDVPVGGVTIHVDGVKIGETAADGTLRGVVSACEGRLRLKAVYGNAARRVKREEFTLEISGIDAAARKAAGGQARNFIAKVQDVFGSGEGGFPGDKDFTDSYAGGDLVAFAPEGPAELRVNVKLATLSLSVPYRNQNDRSETILTSTTSGSALCMPSSAEMQARYWGIEAVSTAKDGTTTRSEMDRRDIMWRSYYRAPKAYDLDVAPRHWQQWGNLRGALAELAQTAAPSLYSVKTAPKSNAVEDIPSAYADGVTRLLAQAQPVVVSTYATAFGHVMTAIGAVVRHDGTSEWLIMNDPNGTLASADSLYGTLDLRGTVGLNAANDPADTRAVQEALTRTGHYKGPTGAPVDAANPDDPTIAAIRDFQGKGGDGVVSPKGATQKRINTRLGTGTNTGYSRAENETNGKQDDRGRHVYYNGETGGKNQGKFRLKGHEWSSVIEPVTPLTKAEIAKRLNQGQPEAEEPQS